MNSVIVKTSSKGKATLDEIDEQVKRGAERAKEIVSEKDVNKLLYHYTILRNNFLILAFELDGMNKRTDQEIKDRMLVIRKLLCREQVFSVATEGNA